MLGKASEANTALQRAIELYEEKGNLVAAERVRKQEGPLRGLPAIS